MKLAFHVSRKPRAQKAWEELTSKYGHVEPESAECIVVLGGDGTMLRALHTYAHYQAPIFGMNLGTLGFLLNEYRIEGLIDRIKKANRFEIHPLRMDVVDKKGKKHSEIAFNEVSVLRETHNTAKMKVFVNDKERISELVCDGILLATAVGSTAYNLSAGGPIVPLSGNLLPLTPISPFRPRRWNGALLRNTCEVRLEILKSVERPVSATADSKEIRDVRSVTIKETRHISKTILYDPDNPLEERIFDEQFAD